MNDIKLVVIDLDGTLLSQKKIIKQEAIDLIRAKQELGVNITIATGRTFERAKCYFEQLDLVTPVITSNGARIIGKKGVIRNLTIPLNIMRDLINVIDNIGFSIIYTISGNEYVYRVTPWINKKRKKDNLYLIDHIFSETDWNSVSVEKIMIWNDNPEKDIRVLEPYFSEIKDKVHYVRYENRCYEVMHKKANKAVGVEFLTKYLKIEMNDVMAIGDDYNDIELLKASKIGVAPANSKPEAKFEADYISPLQRTDAVIEALNRFL